MIKLAASHRDQVIDLLTERLTFERTGVMLYDTILAKLRRHAGRDPHAGEMIAPMRAIRDEEKEHEEWLEAQIRALGGNAHGFTEHARLAETESHGIEEVIMDPNAGLEHLFHALLAAELVDNAGWELLVSLADEAGDDVAKEGFEQRLHDEERHLRTVRKVVGDWARERVLGQSGAP